MRKEDFFEVLGELDDDIVKGAKTAMNKKMNRYACCAIAACLALVLSVGVSVFLIRKDADITVQPGVADATPMVYVNDTLYKQSDDQQGYSELKDEFIYLGQIITDVTSSQSDNTDGVPKDNFHANHPIVGCEVYQYGENIVVKIKDAYWLYIKYNEPEINWNDLSETEKELLDPTYMK